MDSVIKLNIKLTNADKCSVEVETTATILELKEKIAAVLNVPAAQQRLIYKGRVLKDDSTVQFYGKHSQYLTTEIVVVQQCIGYVL